MKFLYELRASCDAFGIHPLRCDGLANFTPILDNVEIHNVGVETAPAMRFDAGCKYQDGFSQSQSGGLSTGGPGWANVAFDTRVGEVLAAARAGDSLVVKGPVPGPATLWEAKLFLRVKREGPAQYDNGLYNEWKSDFIAAKGIAFTPPQSLFTWGWMDSVESAGVVSTNRFCSQFRDGPSPGGHNLPADPMFSWGADTGEQDEGNEIIPDLALTPGTKIEYFVTSNYTCTPEVCYDLPDTTGGNYLEFEILPSFRMDGIHAKFPCVLYVDAFNRGSQSWIENALNVALNGAGPGDPLPDPTSWDRYDYLDAESNWKAPFYRETGGNAGVTIQKLAAIPAVLFDTGTFGPGCTWERDWWGISNWLVEACTDIPPPPQAFLCAGTSVSGIIDRLYPALLDRLGAVHRCDTYSLSGCPPEETENDQQQCVRVDPVPGTPFSAGIPTDVFGNWCPSAVSYGVLGTSGTGFGNRTYKKVGGDAVVEYAEVIQDRAGGIDRFRSCIQDFAYHLMTARDLDVEPDPDLECPSDSTSRVAAIATEISSALRWTLMVSDLAGLGLCFTPSTGCHEGVPDNGGGNSLVNRLHQNRPSPFNPRTTIRYSLAVAGPARLEIFDVSGRRVRTLVNAPQEAGTHEAIWDGTDDSGRPVASGVYWSQLVLRDYRSHKKLVVLK